MRGYFWPRGRRGRLIMGAYVALEAFLGFATVTLAYPLSAAAQAVGYILMAPTLVLALPLSNAIETRLYQAIGYTTATESVTLAVLFGLGALANGCLFTYLRSADGRY